MEVVGDVERVRVVGREAVSARWLAGVAMVQWRGCGFAVAGSGGRSGG